MTGGYLQSMLFLMNRSEPIRQSSLLMVLASGLDDPESLVKGLEALAAESGAPWSHRVLHLQALLEQGQQLSDALRSADGLVPDQTMVAIRVAEESGCLKQVLADEAHRLMSTASITAQSGGGMTAGIAWVAVIGTIVCGLLSFLMMFIVPKFKKIFSDFGVEMPEMTDSVISVSDWVVEFGYLFILPVFTVICYVSWFVLSSSIRRLSEGYFPGSKWFPRYWSPLILRMLSIQVAAEKPISDGLRCILSEFRPGRAQQKLSAVRVRTEAGSDCWEALGENGFLRHREVAFLHAAKRTNHLDWALLHLSKSVERSQDTWRVRIQNAISPVAILVIGAVVGTVCVAMFMPLIELVNKLSPEAMQ